MTKHKKTAKRLTIFLTAYLLCAVRFLYYGPRYFYQLDDYIQYRNIPTNPQAVSHFGLLAARPLAGILDVHFWSLFADHMIWAVLLISLMYTAAALLLWRVFRRHFKLSFLFPIIFILFPTSFEGVYWLSASTRVVVGLFFAAVSAYFLDEFLKKRKATQLLAFAVAQLLAFGFYEQIIVLSVALTAVLIFLNYKGKKDFLTIPITVLNGLIYYLVTSSVKDSPYYSARGDNVLSSILHLDLGGVKYYLREVVPLLLRQLRGAFINAPLAIWSRGFFRGIRQIVSDKAVWYTLLVIILTGLVAWLTARKGLKWHENEKIPDTSRPIFKLIIVVSVLLILPLGPHLILMNPWISLRATVAVYPAIALLIDGLICMIPKKWYVRTAYSTLCAFLTFTLMAGAASELHDYRETTHNDEQFVHALHAAFLESDTSGAVLIYGAKSSYLPDQNYFHNEHIHGITESDWALNGGITALVGTPPPFVFLPDGKNKISSEALNNLTDVIYVSADGSCRRVDIDTNSGTAYLISNGDTLVEMEIVK